MPIPQSPPGTYTNPVGGIVMGDPFVLYHDGLYYLYGSAGRGGFLCWSSPNLVDWTEAGYAYTRPDDHWGSRSFWAQRLPSLSCSWAT